MPPASHDPPRMNNNAHTPLFSSGSNRLDWKRKCCWSDWEPVIKEDAISLAFVKGSLESKVGGRPRSSIISANKPSFLTGVEGEGLLLSDS